MTMVKMITPTPSGMPIEVTMPGASLVASHSLLKAINRI
jgi:hypothetical protein